MKNNTESKPTKNSKWSWLGFFFGYLYYAGYEKLKFAIIMVILFSIPTIGDFFAIFIAVYCGMNAKKDLPIKQIPFNWDNVVIVIFTGVVFGVCFRIWLPTFLGINIDSF